MSAWETHFSGCAALRWLGRIPVITSCKSTPKLSRVHSAVTTREMRMAEMRMGNAHVI